MKYRFLRTRLIIFLCVIPTLSFAQKPKGVDSLKSSTFPKNHFQFNTNTPLPKRAGMYSALLPGLGQSYNKQYWKTGLVYAGLGTLGYIYYFNYKQYRFYQGVYLARLDNDPTTTDTLIQYSTDDINTLRKGYRTYVEYSVLGITAFYAFNIIDAFVAAHLRTFDISRNISLHVQPTINQFRQPAIRCTMALNQ